MIFGENETISQPNFKSIYRIDSIQTYITLFSYQYFKGFHMTIIYVCFKAGMLKFHNTIYMESSPKQKSQVINIAFGHGKTYCTVVVVYLKLYSNINLGKKRTRNS